MKKRLSLAILALLMVSVVAVGCPGLPKLDPPEDIHPAVPNLRCPPEKQWSRMFGGPKCEGATSVQQTADGGFIMAGSTTSFVEHEHDGRNIWLVKTDPEGNKEWSRAFGRSCELTGVDLCDWATSVQQTACGGFIIVGNTFSIWEDGFSHDPFDFWLIKTDPEGNKEWSSTFGGPGSDMARSVQQTSCGGFILAGSTKSFGAGKSDFFVVKTDPQGNKEWSRTFGGRRSEKAYSVEQTACGGFIIAGSTSSFGAGRGDFWLVKTDPEGNEQWSRTFGGSWWEGATSVQQTTCGGFILAGRIFTRPTPPGVPVMADLWLVKADSQGNKEWSWTFLDSFAQSVQQTACGGFIIARWSDLIKTDPLGNKEWHKLSDALGRPSVRSVQQTACGGFVLAGSIECRERNGEFFLVKLAPEQ
ncbi:hypothetical protein M1N79_01550 [Dehalococcoidia bacterium]|nr:hypothetical protein [Dehalococcoidia bacterium]